MLLGLNENGCTKDQIVFHKNWEAKNLTKCCTYNKSDNDHNWKLWTNYIV